MKKMFFVVAFLTAAAITAMPWTGSNLNSGISFLAPDSGTPDAYGYVYVKSGDPGGPTYNWMDISTTGTLVTGLMDDNVVGPFPIGFDFPYYWYNVDQVYIGSNGYLSFSSNANLADPFHNIPLSTPPNDLLAIFTGDLDHSPGVGSPAVYYYTSATLDTFIVTFDSVQEWAVPGTYHTFQVILTKADSCITMQYGPQNGTYNHSGSEHDMVGIENNTGTIGLQYFRDGSAGAGASRPVDGMAVAYIPPESTTLQIHDVGVSYIDNPLTGGIFRDRGSVYYPVAEIKNYGNQPESNFNAILRIYRKTGATILFADTVAISSTLNPGDVFTCSYDSFLLPDLDTTYRVQVRTYLTGDMTPANDSITLRLQTFSPPAWYNYGNDTIPVSGSSWNGDSSGYGNMYEPPNYPFTIDSVGFFPATVSANGDVELIIMDDDGTDGGPGTILFSTRLPVTTAQAGLWFKAPVSPAVVINDGAFYVGQITVLESTFSTGTSAVPPGAVSRRAYEFTGSWAPSRESSTQDVWVACHGTWSSVGVDEIGITVPSLFRLACPTFVTAKSVFSISVVSESDVTISLYDLSGRNVRNLYQGKLSAGNHELSFNSEDLSSGLYFLRASVNGNERSLKVNIVK
ncbi:T9SS type A sorting domain-containing protein [candidate division WOR-3 bacterium]|nr:T9SS type A sorting domain-containing protein [candidate division WOR-3 bacterium]